MTRRLLVFGLVLGACTQQPVQTPARSLDRPADVALVCAISVPGRGVQLTALENCDPTPEQPKVGVPINDTGVDLPDAGGADASSIDRFSKGQLVAFVANAARGEVAVVANGNTEFFYDPQSPVTSERVLVRPVVPVRTGVKGTDGIIATFPSIIDLDPAVPGFSFLSVGQNPERIRTSQDGCRAVTANVDSCDVSVIDIYGLLKTLAAETGSPTSAASTVSRIMPRTPDGRVLGARPTWIELTGETTAQSAASDPRDTNACNATRPYEAYVAFPSCSLVGVIDLATGELKQALRITPSGGEIVDPASVSCPVECSGVPLDGGNDAGAPPVTSTTALPRSLAVDADENGVDQRIYIADANADHVIQVTLAQGRFTEVSTLPLAAPGGITTVRLSPRTDFGAGVVLKYLYAFARDRSIRVIDTSTGSECETNPDGQRLNLVNPIADDQGNLLRDANDVEQTPDVVQRKLRCLPLGTPRSPLFDTPGIVLPGGVLPRDVVFTSVPVPRPVTSGQTAVTASGGVTFGAFAWVVDSSGRVTPVTLHDDCPPPNEPARTVTPTQACTLDGYRLTVKAALAYANRPQPQAIELVPNRLRNFNARYVDTATITDNIGPARVTIPPITGGGGGNDLLTTVAPYLCEFKDADGSPAKPRNSCQPPQATSVVQQVAFRDAVSVRPELWTMSWEGSLLPVRVNGQVGAGTVDDVGAAFCTRGIVPGDKLTLPGCTRDSDCDRGQRCYRDPAAPLDVLGLCFSSDENLFAAAQQACQPWTRTARRYRITEATTGQLRFEELPEPEYALDTHVCTREGDPTECTDIQVLGLDNGIPRVLPTTCMRERDGLARCRRACQVGAVGTDSLCGLGFVCARSELGFDQCLRAPLPSAATLPLCFPGAQAYQAVAGDSFTVTGTLSGVLDASEVDPATGQCRLPSSSQARYRLMRARIPLDERLVSCTSVLGNLDWLAPLDTTSIDNPSNACRVDVPAPCTDDSDCARGQCVANRCSVPDVGVRFANPIFDTVVVVPTRRVQPGVLPDTATGGLVISHVPAVNAEITVSVTGGFNEIRYAPSSNAGAALFLKAAAIGPDRHTIYLVDEGRQPALTGLRGQVLRFFADARGTSDPQFIVR